MRYRPYLAGGLEASELGFGAWQIGVQSGWAAVSANEAEAMIETALDHGVNFFDTAPNYGNGTSETRLGQVFGRIDRSKIIINTKFGHSDAGVVDYDPKWIRPSVEKSLARLQVDYVDSVIIHSPPMALLDGNKNDHYEVFEQLQDEGKIRAYGASVDFDAEAKLLLETTNARVVEGFFNVLHQDFSGVFALAEAKGTAIIAKIPFDSGWLTGKYNQNSKFTGVRTRWTSEDKRIRAELVNQVSDLLGGASNLPAAALQFCTAFDAVSTVIPGATSKNQLLSNLKAIEHPMPQDMREKLVAFYEKEVRHLKLPW